MRRDLVLTVAVAFALAAATAGRAGLAQTSASPAAAEAAVPASAATDLLSVTVQDQQGRAVRGLTPQNFRLTEGGAPQKITGFGEHPGASLLPKAPAYPALPPGVFTNYMPLAAGETLNVLILDALNTPVSDEAFIRWQLLQYARQANPRTRIAVFGLANRLILLQGFTSDPATLRDIAERKLIARVPVNRGAEQTISGAPSAVLLAANVRQFEESLGAMEVELRAQYTLDAFNTLAHYLVALPGRKNVIWCAGVFPFNLSPDATGPHPFKVEDIDQDELRETVGLLGKAQVAVYPVDARGLIREWAGQSTVGDAARDGHPNGVMNDLGKDRAKALGKDLGKTVQVEPAEHAMMEAMAKGTGGRAFVQVENLAEAVSRAVADGSNYYTLGYTPEGSPAGGARDSDRNGSYRPLEVAVSGAGEGAELAYRRAVYTPAASEEPKVDSGNDSSNDSADKSRAAAYRRAAMSRGGPTPQDLLFRVRVLPAAATTEAKLAPKNQLAPVLPPKGPFRRYELDFLALPGELTFTEQANGRRLAKVDFLAYVFDTDGDLLNEAGQSVTLEPLTGDPSRIAHSVIRSRLEVSVSEGYETFLRIVVLDVTSNRLGVVEIPTSSVSSLPPEPDAGAKPPAPAAGTGERAPGGRPTLPQD